MVNKCDVHVDVYKRQVPRGPVRNTSGHPSGMIGPRGIVPKETGTENGEKAGCDKKAALTAQKFGE